MMAASEDTRQLILLLPHWIEHNNQHAAEFRKWAARAGMARADLLIAAEQLEAASSALEAALKRLEE